mgnify:CR=1 FL=1
MGENDEKIIYQDYINCYDCWVRASFIPAAWDAEGNLTHVMLTDEGARVETASNGKEAVDAFAHSSPQYYDVILMDMMMPVMNGCTANACAGSPDIFTWKSIQTHLPPSSQR